MTASEIVHDHKLGMLRLEKSLCIKKPLNNILSGLFANGAIEQRLTNQSLLLFGRQGVAALFRGNLAFFLYLLTNQ